MLKVTIGIPTYNQASFIGTAVRSALAQTYPLLEIVIADDASTDNTEELLSAFAKDPRIKYTKNQENLGRIGNYRQLLYDRAQGDWYLNLDGDDYLTDPDFITHAIELLKSDDTIVAIVADCSVLDEHTGTSIVYSSDYKNGAVVDGYRFLNDVQNGAAQTTHLSTLYSRRKAMDIGFYRLDIISSDFESLYRLVLHGNIAYYKSAVGVWRLHGKNTVATKKLEDSIRNLQMPAAVAEHAAEYARDLSRWKQKMQQSMIAAIFIEGKKNKQLLKAFFKLFPAYPFAVVRLLVNVSSALKHLGKK